MAKKQSFLHGAVILGAAVALVKVIGALFKIPLGNLLTGNGFAYFNMAYLVYGVLLVISTAGLPVAVSRMVSEASARGREAEINSILRAALSIFILVGTLCSVFMFAFAKEIAVLVGSPNAVYAIRALAPSVFFVAVMSAFRGFYQGHSNMYPTAISQVIEALSKLVIGYFLAALLISRGYPEEIAAAGAILGVTTGTVLGALFMIFRRLSDRKLPTAELSNGRSYRELVRTLLSIAVPITIGAGALALTSFIDGALVIRRLAGSAGFTASEAEWLFGAYGLSQTLFNFPSAFIVPFAVSVVPAVTEAITRGNRKKASKTIETALRVTALLALPAAVGLSLLSAPILNLLFPNRPEEAAAAAFPLTLLSIAIVFNCAVLLSNSILQSLGHSRIPVFTMLCGSAVKIVANWILVGNPEININGAPIGTCLCYALIMCLNLYFITKKMSPAPKWTSTFPRPFLAAAVMGIASVSFLGLQARFFPSRLGVLFVVALSAFVYLVMVLALKAVRREDLLLLPKGEKIANFLRL